MIKFLVDQNFNEDIVLYEDPPGILRVGKSRVLLELVIRAFQRGQTPESIVQSYDTLRLPDVYAVVSYYLANPAPFEEYLRRCDKEADAVRGKLEAAGMTGRVSKEELTAAQPMQLIMRHCRGGLYAEGVAYQSPGQA